MNRFARMLALIGKSVKVIAPLLVGMVVLIGIIAWLAGAFERKIEPGRVSGKTRTLSDQPTDVVHEINKEYIEEAIGALKAESRTVISARVLATINQINVAAGDEVREGDLLIALDSKEIETKKKQAEEAQAAAISQQTEAIKNFDRIKMLFAQKAVSKSELDEATRRREVADSEVRRTGQALQETAVMLSYTSILAPKNGRIVDRLAEAGDTASPGKPLLVLYDASSLRLEAPVPEQLAVKLQVGQTLTVYVDALDRQIDATVDEIVPQADIASRSFLVKVAIPKSDDLFEGMFGRLRIPVGVRRHLCLNTAAIQQVGQLQFVDVVLENNELEKRYIKTGRLGMPQRIEVLSGVKAGERVVVHSRDHSDDPDLGGTADGDAN